MSTVPDGGHRSSRWLIAGSGKRLYQLATLPQLTAVGSIVGLWSPYQDERRSAAERFTVSTADDPLDLARGLRPDLIVASVLTDQLVAAAADGTRLALLGPLDWFDGRRGLKALLIASRADAPAIFIPSPIAVAGLEAAEGPISIRWHSPAGADRMSELLESGRAPSALGARAASLVASLLTQPALRGSGDPILSSVETVVSPVADRIELRGRVGRIGFRVSYGAGAGSLSLSPRNLILTPESHRFAIDHPCFLVDALRRLGSDSTARSLDDGCYAAVALHILKEASQ
jgi:hypothetical protein